MKSLEIVHEFGFPEAANRVKVSEDGHSAICTGTYKPQMRVYDLLNLSVKFERHTNAENIDFIMLSDDWTKSIHLQGDRSIEFHTKGNMHYRTRIPHFGRDLDYNKSTCDLYIAAAETDELYRLNLDQGRFLAPFTTDNIGLSTVDVNPAHGLLSIGSESGVVEFWDTRSRSRITSLPPQYPSFDPSSDPSVTAFAFSPDGLNFAVGTAGGCTFINDLRSPHSYIQKDQGFGFAVNKLDFLKTHNDYISSSSRVLMSSDRRMAKLWATNSDNTTPIAFIESQSAINDVCHIPDSGLFFIANESPKIATYFIPSLGPAPKWCSFIVDEEEESSKNAKESLVYDNYRFVTRDQLQQLNLNKVIGTKAARAYMHGFFISTKLYEEAKAIANPFAYEEYRQQEIEKKLAKEKESRIRNVKRTKVKLNQTLADRLTKKGGEFDSRFADVFKDRDFAIDQDSLEYRLLNPTKSTKVHDEDEEEEEAEPDIDDNLAEKARDVDQALGEEEEDLSSDDASILYGEEDESDNETSDEKVEPIRSNNVSMSVRRPQNSSSSLSLSALAKAKRNGKSKSRPEKVKHGEMTATFNLNDDRKVARDPEKRVAKSGRVEKRERRRASNNVLHRKR